MATSSRLRKNVLPIFKLAIDGGAAVSYADDLKEINLKPRDRDKDDVTFYEAANGLVAVTDCELTCVQSYDATALFGACYDKATKTVIVTYGPYGNAVPTATQPHFTFSGTIQRPDLGNEAAAPTADYTGKMAKIVIKGTTDVVVLKA